MQARFIKSLPLSPRLDLPLSAIDPGCSANYTYRPPLSRRYREKKYTRGTIGKLHRKYTGCPNPSSSLTWLLNRWVKRKWNFTRHFLLRLCLYFLILSISSINKGETYRFWVWKFNGSKIMQVNFKWKFQYKFWIWVNIEIKISNETI